MADVSPEMFDHEEWVRYTGHQTQAAVLAVLGVTAFVSGFAIESSGLAMEGADLSTLTIDIWRMLGGALIAVLGVTLIPFAIGQWNRARSVRRWAETRREVESLYATILAAVVLEVLRQAAEKVRAEADDG